MKKGRCSIVKSLRFIVFACFILLIFAGILLASASNQGQVSLIVEGGRLTIYINSPLNTTYNFARGSSLIINLEVYASEAVNTWMYSLFNVKHSVYANQSVVFTPNITFIAVRGSNIIEVFANDSTGLNTTESVTFYVSVPNSSPVLLGIENQTYVCEESSLNYPFSASDVDEDDLTFDLSPKNPFFVSAPVRIDWTDFNSTLFSGTLHKSSVGNYSEIVSVSDGEYVDTRNMNISVIEINNAPSVGNIGVQTIYSRGENSTFYKEISVSDVESGNQSSGNFTFNLSFISGTPFFNASRFGIMNVTANSSLVGVYNLSLCVSDSGIKNIHPNISLCGQTGGNITVCQNFSLTITDSNRAPTITNYYPSSLSFTSGDADEIRFNITKYDPDGTIPDSYWYVDGVFSKYYSGSSVDGFNYTFGCGNSGTHAFKVEITDGLVNDSLQWNVSLSTSSCPVSPSGGGGGGGGGGAVCSAKWACGEWNICQNAQRSLEIGTLSREDFRIVKDYCDKNFFDVQACGFHIRACLNMSSCTSGKPAEVEACNYVAYPSCEDGITNCHEGQCELLADCGGPCKPCPTCSDGKQNQGEENIDCGGPCPQRCPVEIPLSKRLEAYLLPILILLGLIILVIITIMLIRIRRIKKALERVK